MPDANLLVTYEPSHAGSSKVEMEKVLKALKQKPKILKSEIDGVFMLRVMNPKKIVKSLVKLKSRKMFAHTFHWIPIDKWVPSNLKTMQSAIKKLKNGIKKNNKWKMDLHKRNFDIMQSTDLIMKLTEVVDRPHVDLDNPQKIITVQIIGKKAGLALLNKDELFIA